MTPQRYVASLAGVRVRNVFNPYSSRCPVWDGEDAPKRRAQLLTSILNAATSTEVDSIWIGRDLGFRGGRRTGLALTDDIHVLAHASRWGIKAERFTVGAAVAERTAQSIWRLLQQIPSTIFLWNVFPLHPHEPGNEFTNRPHNPTEREIGEDFLRDLLLLLRPRRLIALGNDAALAARKVANGHELISVRHPSYGGQTMFSEKVRHLYGIHRKLAPLLD